MHSFFSPSICPRDALIILKLLLVNLVNEKTFREIQSMRKYAHGKSIHLASVIDSNCPEQIFQLDLSTLKIHFETGNKILNTNSYEKKEKKTNNVIDSDHVINNNVQCQRRFRTNSIICPQLHAQCIRIGRNCNRVPSEH